MKVLLIRPPHRFGRGEHMAMHADMPLALMSLGAVAERAGHEVVLFDGAVQAELPAPELGQGGFLHFGASWDEVAQTVQKTSPDIVGLSCLFYTQMPAAMEVARITRRVLPDVPIVVGGAPVTVRPEDFLAEPAITAAVLYEGELTLTQLLEALEQGADLSRVPGIVWRGNGGIQRNPPAGFIEDLDMLPGPAYHLIDLQRYLRVADRAAGGNWRWKPRPIITVQTSRGCPFKCTFCATHLHMGRRYRAQSPDRVLDHVRFVAAEIGVRHIHFIDDNLAQNQRRFHAILDGLIAIKREGLPIAWETPIGMRTDRLNYDLLAKAKESGCQSIYLTVESGSQRVIDEVIQKHLCLDKVLEAADACNRLGIKARAGFIMGLPGETLAEMQQTIEFARLLKHRYGIRGHVSMATPLYGTRLHEVCVERGYLKQEMTPENVARSFVEGGMIETEDWTIQQLHQMRKSFKRQGSWLHRVVRAARQAITGRRARA